MIIAVLNANTLYVRGQDSAYVSPDSSKWMETYLIEYGKQYCTGALHNMMAIIGKITSFTQAASVMRAVYVETKWMDGPRPTVYNEPETIRTLATSGKSV